MQYATVYPNDAICLRNHVNSIITFKTVRYKDKIRRSLIVLKKFNFFRYYFYVSSKYLKLKVYIRNYARLLKFISNNIRNQGEYYYINIYLIILINMCIYNI